MASPSRKETITGLIDPEELFAMAEEEKGTLPSPLPERGEEADTLPRDARSDELLEEEDIDDEAEQSYDEGIEAAFESMEFSDYRKDAILAKREDTRSRLAIAYTLATFFVFILSMGIAVLDGLNRDVSIIANLTELIPLISGVFLGTLGFVLGYYFRRGDEE